MVMPQPKDSCRFVFAGEVDLGQVAVGTRSVELNIAKVGG